MQRLLLRSEVATTSERLAPAPSTAQICTQLYAPTEYYHVTTVDNAVASVDAHLLYVHMSNYVPSQTPVGIRTEIIWASELQPIKRNKS